MSDKDTLDQIIAAGPPPKKRGRPSKADVEAKQLYDEAVAEKARLQQMLDEANAIVEDDDASIEDMIAAPKASLKSRPSAVPAKSEPPASRIEELLAELVKANLSAEQRAQADDLRKKVTFGEYKRRHPRPVLKVPATQNWRDVNPRGLSDDTINKMAELKRGAYLGGKVVVEKSELTGAINFDYDASSPDKRMSLPWSSFSDLVNKIYSEQKLKEGVKTGE